MVLSLSMLIPVTGVYIHYSLTLLCIYHSLLIQSVDRYLGCFCFLTITGSAVWTCLYVSLHVLLTSVEIYLIINLPGYRLCVCLPLVDTASFPKWF